MALILSERGFGSVQEILHARLDLALDMWNFRAFRIQQEETFAALNPPPGLKK